jgi:hypothetical protein
VYLNQCGGADRSGLPNLAVLVGGWIGIEQDDDAIVFSLVKNFRSGEYALSCSTALRFVNGDVHLPRLSDLT